MMFPMFFIADAFIILTNIRYFKRYVDINKLNIDFNKLIIDFNKRYVYFHKPDIEFCKPDVYIYKTDVEIIKPVLEYHWPDDVIIRLDAVVGRRKW